MLLKGTWTERQMNVMKLLHFFWCASIHKLKLASCHVLVVTYLKAATKNPATASQFPVESNSFLPTMVKESHLKAPIRGKTHALCFTGTFCCYVQCFTLWYLHFKPVL